MLKKKGGGNFIVALSRKLKVYFFTIYKRIAKSNVVNVTLQIQGNKEKDNLRIAKWGGFA